MREKEAAVKQIKGHIHSNVQLTVMSNIALCLSACFAAYIMRLLAFKLCEATRHKTLVFSMSHTHTLCLLISKVLAGLRDHNSLGYTGER